MMAGFYRYFLDGIPIYLARHYWWAYLWPRAVWFFDHQPIINTILFGQYKKLMQATLVRLEHAPKQRVVQLTCVYGSLTPALIHHLASAPLHLTDVTPIQLALARSKAKKGPDLLVTRMNTEQLGYKANSFSTVVMFFLLHEMPAEARKNTLSECMRILAPGGSLLLTEYGPLPTGHLLYRFPPSRWLITGLEPFLNGFWHDNLLTLLQEYAAAHGKRIEIVSHTHLFAHFYRVTEFGISQAG